MGSGQTAGGPASLGSLPLLSATIFPHRWHRGKDKPFIATPPVICSECKREPDKVMGPLLAQQEEGG